MLTPWAESGFWAPAAILAAGLFLSLGLEKLVRPRCPGLRRPWPAAFLHAGLLLLCWAAVLAVTARPVFALLLTLAGQLLIVQVSNAKHRALREPFIFSDFGIFSQTIKHPRLYLPFLGLGRALLIGAAAAAAAGIGLWLEPPVSAHLLWSAIMAAGGSAALVVGVLAARPPLLEPEQDIARHGLFASIAQYWLREKTHRPLRKTNLPSIVGEKKELPDVVVIQSESFFDPRGIWSGIRPEVLQHYDEACAASALHGKLTVPAWGANTMRPEFAFLTGITPTSLDIHRFNPYRRAARQPVRALPEVLREAGYRTTCIHPHPARFFRRDRAFPNLGFERFLDHRAFPNAPKCGPYIGDAAVTDKLLQELGSANKPSFFFVITMENHGPLHLEDIAAEEWRGLFAEPPPSACHDLAVYVRHLRNADRQLGRLRKFLRARSRPYLLLFYGEHLPSMPTVYDALGMPDGRTDYLFETRTGEAAGRRDLPVEELAGLLLGAVA